MSRHCFLDNKCQSEIGALIEENGEVLNHLEDINILQDPENYPAYEFYSNELKNGSCEYFDVQNNLNDHDLGIFDKDGQDINGYNCVKWLCDFYQDYNLMMNESMMFIHSKNPIGSANMKNYLKNFIKWNM